MITIKTTLKKYGDEFEFQIKYYTMFWNLLIEYLFNFSVVSERVLLFYYSVSNSYVF